MKADTYTKEMARHATLSTLTDSIIAFQMHSARCREESLASREEDFDLFETNNLRKVDVLTTIYVQVMLMYLLMGTLHG